MSRREVDAVCPQMRVVHLSEPSAIGMVAILRPKRAFRPRSGQKFARVSAQYGASPAPLFAYFFWRNRKSRSAKQRSRRCRKRGSSGENRKKGQMWASAPTEGRNRKSRPSETQLRSHRKSGSPVKPEKGPSLPAEPSDFITCRKNHGLPYCWRLRTRPAPP